jgi:hypothetical protein
MKLNDNAFVDENFMPDGGFSWDQSTDWQLNDLEVNVESVKFSNKPGELNYSRPDIGNRNFNFLLF